jgi:hypothetical protein
MRRILYAVRALLGGSQLDRELDSEVRFHLEMEAAVRGLGAGPHAVGRIRTGHGTVACAACAGLALHAARVDPVRTLRSE